MNEEQLASRRVHCPYCDAPFDLLVDASQGSHLTWEDCHVCCAPIQVRVEVSPAGGLDDDTDFTLALGRDDEVL
ncbi:CPXCG motif-containing cysteine-rich protein [Halomonas sp. BM-2019]|uniref:CPXCG motif-containing cysteine-rich protein n=1 Tax=Halomonas sp. BM-2019 TaxID=2811227 RepID=UPI001B3C259C|nr:MAG: CPXCG motif-containing cysteine-rich protein [Halomonas sp. BM-2019]